MVRPGLPRNWSWSHKGFQGEVVPELPGGWKRVGGKGGIVEENTRTRGFGALMARPSQDTGLGSPSMLPNAVGCCASHFSQSALGCPVVPEKNRCPVPCPGVSSQVTGCTLSALGSIKSSLLQQKNPGEAAGVRLAGGDIEVRH